MRSELFRRRAAVLRAFWSALAASRALHHASIVLIGRRLLDRGPVSTLVDDGQGRDQQPLSTIDVFDSGGLLRRDQRPIRLKLVGIKEDVLIGSE